MGEYAMYRGNKIKIGTCEDCYYLRADQRQLVTSYEFEDCMRYRFPWPDEDRIEPGAFDPYHRACPLYGLTAPTELASEHHSVQFVAQAGYNVCLPCPESGPSSLNSMEPIRHAGLYIHRNGFAGRVLLCQQRLFEGHLVGIARCGGCGLKWRLSYRDALSACEGLLEEAERKGEWYLKVAERLKDGYESGS